MHVTLCHWVSNSSRFERFQCLHLQGEAVMILRPLHLQDDSTTICPNMGNHPLSNAASTPHTTPKSSATLLCDLQNVPKMYLDYHWNFFYIIFTVHFINNNNIHQQMHKHTILYKNTLKYVIIHIRLPDMFQCLSIILRGTFYHILHKTACHWLNVKYLKTVSYRRLNKILS
jgi:hypothetical protein